MIPLLEERRSLSYFNHKIVFIFIFLTFKLSQKFLNIIVLITFFKYIASLSLIDLGHLSVDDV
jgi:hypothetical protein